MIQKTTESPIDEIHRTRREISDRFGGDVFAIAEDAARRQAASHRPVWKPKHEQSHPGPVSAASRHRGKAKASTPSRWCLPHRTRIAKMAATPSFNLALIAEGLRVKG